MNPVRGLQAFYSHIVLPGWEQRKMIYTILFRSCVSKSSEIKDQHTDEPMACRSTGSLSVGAILDIWQSKFGVGSRATFFLPRAGWIFFTFPKRTCSNKAKDFNKDVPNQSVIV